MPFPAQPQPGFRNSEMSVGRAEMGRELRKRISKSHLPTRMYADAHIDEPVSVSCANKSGTQS